MPTGTVKWFNNAKGFGFILPEGGGEDLFAHYSAIEMDGYKTLKAGQAVSFEVVKGEKGYHANHIRVMPNAEARKPSASNSDASEASRAANAPRSPKKNTESRASAPASTAIPLVS